MQSHSLHVQDTFLPIPGLISSAGLVLAETCSVQWVTLRAWHLGLFLRRLHSRIKSSRTHKSMLANRWTMFVWTCCTLVIWHCKNSCKTQVHVHMHQPGQLTWKSFYLTGWNAWCWLVGSHTLYYAALTTQHSVYKNIHLYGSHFSGFLQHQQFITRANSERLAHIISARKTQNKTVTSF